MKLKLQMSLVLFSIIFFGCETEQYEQESEQSYFEVSEFIINHSTSSRVALNNEASCFTLDLIAGRHMLAGSVSISKTDTDLILTYTMQPNWIIGVTHVSIGDCDEEWVPTTGSGNPKIGKFSHTEPHSQDVNKVVYQISLDVLPENKDQFCFAAHAEVYGPDGEETAWAGALDDNDDDSDDDSGGGVFRTSNFENGYNVVPFSGRSWAMYIEALQSFCTN